LVKKRLAELTSHKDRITLQPMTQPDLDQLRLAYKQATDAWVEAIRAEEALATPDHSMVAMEKWDDAHFREQDAHRKYDVALEAYKSGLRAVNYGI
jgi:hypothetical protein